MEGKFGLIPALDSVGGGAVGKNRVQSETGG